MEWGVTRKLSGIPQNSLGPSSHLPSHSLSSPLLLLFCFFLSVQLSPLTGSVNFLPFPFSCQSLWGTGRESMSLAPGRRKDPGLCLTDSQEAKSLVATMSCHACPCRVITSSSTSSFYQQLVSLAWAGSQGSLSLHPQGHWHCLSFILLFSSLSSSTYPCIPVSLSLSLLLRLICSLSLSFPPKWEKENDEFSFGFTYLSNNFFLIFPKDL